ncbi:MAG: translocation/assembly module TamB domain-containing protein [Planctomycetota bacterium]
MPELGASGLVDLELRAEGTRARPRLEVTLSGRELALGPLTGGALEARLRQDDESLRVETLRATLPGAEVTAGGILPLRWRDDALEFRPWRDSDLRFAGRVDDAAALRPFGLPEEVDFASLDLTGALEAGALRVAVGLAGPSATEWLPDEELPARLDLRGEVGAETTRLELEIPTHRGLALQGTGSLAAGLGERWDDALVSRFRSAAAELVLEAKALDLSPWAALAPAIVKLAGRLDARVAARGPLDALRLDGRITIEDLEARTEGDLPTLDRGRIEIALSDRRVELVEVRGLLGYGEVRVSGTADFGEDPARPTIALHATGDNALVARNEYLRARSDFDLRAEGPLDALLVTGRVTVTDALYSRPFSLAGSGVPNADDRFQIFTFRRPPLSGLRFDLDVDADRSIRVENELVQGRVSVDLHLGGDGAVPRPEGRAWFEDLDVRLPFSKLKIERGDVVFDAGDPFSPRLAISGRSRMRGHDLQVEVTGRLPDQRVIVRADPYLLQRTPSSSFSRNDAPGFRGRGLARAALTRAGSLLTDDFLLRSSVRAIPTRESLADRFQVEDGRLAAAARRRSRSSIASCAIYLRAEKDRYDDYNLDLGLEAAIPVDGPIDPDRGGASSRPPARRRLRATDAPSRRKTRPRGRRSCCAATTPS